MQIDSNSSLQSELSVLVISRHSPFASSLPREAIDYCLAAGTFDQSAAIYLCGDGVYQLLPQHSSVQTSRKDTFKMLQALPLYGVDQIYVCLSDAESRGISLEQIPDFVTPVSRLALKELTHQAKHVLSF